MADEQKNIVPLAPEQTAVILSGDPDVQVSFGRKSAVALTNVISTKPKKVMINGEQYLEYEDWMTLARFYGATCGVEWTRPIERDVDGKKLVVGYEARAYVKMGGNEVSSAEAMCTRDERNWKSRDEFMLRSMAQTRASAKALRNVFAWVAVLAGYKPTPAEEMDGVAAEAKNTTYGEHYAGADDAPPHYEPMPPSAHEVNGAVGDLSQACSDCGVGISDKVANYSKGRFGKLLCYEHQKSQPAKTVSY